MPEIAEKKIYSISQLTRDIKLILENNFGQILIKGEISNFRIPSSGHFYFTLKDEMSQIRAVMFRFQNKYIKFQPADGLLVIGGGRISLYEKRGEYQIILDYMEPQGKGALQLAFEQLKEKLKKEGLFDDFQKKPLPLLPRRIGVVTSHSGAAFRDILRVIHRRYANVEILLYPVSVQGEEAPRQISRAIRYLSRSSGVDVIIVGRGGGSIEDLWAFNEEVVARAIFASRIPIISAVGHEIDHTIADFVADLRAPTPSAAAELVVQNKKDLKIRSKDYSFRLVNALRQKMELLEERFKGTKNRLGNPEKKVADLRLWSDDLSTHLLDGTRRLITQKREKFHIEKGNLLFRNPEGRINVSSTYYHNIKKGLNKNISQVLSGKLLALEKRMDRLNSLNPLSVLRRGYSITSRVSTGEIIKDADGVRVGEEISVKLHRGKLFCRVGEIINQPMFNVGVGINNEEKNF